MSESTTRKPSPPSRQRRRGTSRSSAPATSASRSPGSSPRPRQVLLIDDVPGVVEALNRGESHIEDVPPRTLRRSSEDGRSPRRPDYDALRDADAILIALPTPLSKQREPDLSIVETAVPEIAPRLRPGHLSCSNRRPTRARRGRSCSRSSRRAGSRSAVDFNLAFSPERVDPGTREWRTQNVPKIVGGITEACTERAAALYGARSTPCTRSRRRRRPS